MVTSMDRDDRSTTGPRHEDRPHDREHDDGSSVDDRFRSLLEGLRTTLPGAQVLVAFLLILPVQDAFTGFTSVEKIAYYVAFGGSLASSILLIAPSVHQRMRSPKSGVRRRTESHLASAVRLSIIGSVMLLVAMIAAAYLVTSLVASTVAAVIAATVFAVIGLYTWVLQPLVVFE